jgi:hypothetical protein
VVISEVSGIHSPDIADFGIEFPADPANFCILVQVFLVSEAVRPAERRSMSWCVLLAGSKIN